jgi:hypothetical protein
MALNLREVLNHMSPKEYAISFVFWTRGFGRHARKIFGDAAVAKFEFETPGGFFDIGQNGYLPRVQAKMADNLSQSAATAEVDAEIRRDILAAPIAYGATMLPIFYRGIWVDQFAFFGIPALMVMTAQALRRRYREWWLLFSIGWFNLLAYTALSLNIPRYQLTALPSIAIASGLAIGGLVQWHYQRGARQKELKRRDTQS